MDLVKQLSPVEWLLQQQEKALQALWAQQNFSAEPLRTLCGRSILIHFPGWLNRNSGPDFLEARVQIDEIIHQGAIEIHLESSLWERHLHHRNPVYNQVILHVTVQNSQGQNHFREDGSVLPELALAGYLKPETRYLAKNPDQLLSDYDEKPGYCGIAAEQLGEKSLIPLIQHAAEFRVEKQVQSLRDCWQKTSLKNDCFSGCFEVWDTRATKRFLNH